MTIRTLDEFTSALEGLNPGSSARAMKVFLREYVKSYETLDDLDDESMSKLFAALKKNKHQNYFWEQLFNSYHESVYVPVIPGKADLVTKASQPIRPIEDIAKWVELAPRNDIGLFKYGLIQVLKKYFRYEAPIIEASCKKVQIIEWLHTAYSWTRETKIGTLYSAL